MRLFEKQSLPRSAGKINQANVIAKDKNVLGGNIFRRNTCTRTFL